ncbi:MAG: SCP2 sterol-binding domain-containing protein [Pseudomonadota bacterium]
MDPLERLLRPIAGMVNRQVQSKTPARELCGELAGKVVAIRVRDTSLAMYFAIDADGISMSLDGPEPDLAITGTLFSLASLAASGGEGALRDGSFEVAGDVYTAQAFQQLMSYGKPDLEEELSGLVGDVAAHTIGDAARSIGAWMVEARGTMRQNVSEYLQEESQAVPSRYEVDRFRQRVNTLRDDVDRLEARLTRLVSGAGK